MNMRFVAAIALLWACSGLAFASVPEIDGSLSIQALAFISGALMLLKRKK